MQNDLLLPLVWFDLEPWPCAQELQASKSVALRASRGSGEEQNGERRARGS
jgi:hypothetical protein